MLLGGLSILIVAFVDWKVTPNASLGFLYLFPILFLALFASKAQIVALALVCGVLREVLSPLPLDVNAIVRLLMGTMAFLGTGLFVSELARNGRLAVAHASELKQQVELRRSAQEELQVLIESSPAAILTAGADGRVLLANEAAHRLLNADSDSLRGQSIQEHLPALASALGQERLLLHTSMECVGRRRGGEVFLAHVWFSTYSSLEGTRLAAIVLDGSEQLRDREVSSLGALATASRVLFGAVSHEIRNLAAAAAVAHANLERKADLADDVDFRALGALVVGLEQVAASDLRLGASPVVETIELNQVMSELRIVLEPMAREEDTELVWTVPPGLPSVLGEPHSVLQIFMNLAQNSVRAMATCRDRRLVVSGAIEPEAVLIRFEDSGPGVADAERLFRPFASHEGSTGLGLFVSRTIARAYAGDLRHEPVARGSRFVVRLARHGSARG